MKYITTVDGQEYLVEVMDDGRISVNGTIYQVSFESVSDEPLYSILIDGFSYEAFVQPDEELWQVLLRGSQYAVKVEDEREKRLRAAAGSSQAVSDEYILKAPMPGLVVSVPVGEGDLVGKGDVLVILESMKMQNELRAPIQGQVLRVRAQIGNSVERGQVLLVVGREQVSGKPTL